MNYTIESIADFCKGKTQIAFPGSTVTRINIDHRVAKRDNALFAAIKGARFDGHDFIPELPEEAFSLLLSESKSVASLTLRQSADQKAEQESVRQNRWLSQRQWRTKGGIRKPNYGQRGRK